MLRRVTSSTKRRLGRVRQLAKRPSSRQPAWRRLARQEEEPMTPQGLIRMSAARPVAEVIDRLETALAAKGLSVFARVDHAAGAAAVGLALPPTTLLMFGNAKAGTPLMQAEPTIGIDLPLKMLAWEDAAGHAWLAYNDPAWLAHRHGIEPATQPALAAMAALLDALAREAAA
jgi:uncharacterized protein (DUF302 family)